MSMQEDLQSLGLSKEESIVYDALVSFGARTLGQISVYTGLSLEAIEQALDALNRKGYAKRAEGKNKASSVYIPLSPKIVVSSDVAKKLNDDLTAIQQKILQDWENAQKLLETHSHELVDRTQKEIEEHVTSIDEFTADRTKALETWVKNSKESIKQTIENHVNNINDTISSQINDLLGVIEQNVSDIGDESTQARNNILEVYNTFSASLRETLEHVKKDSETVLGEAQQHLEAHVTTVNAEQEKALKELTKALDTQKKALLTDLGKTKTAMMKAVDKTATSLGSDAEKIVVTEVTGFITKVEEFLAWFKEQQQSIMDTAAKAEEQSEQIIQAQFDQVKEKFSKLIVNLAEEFRVQTEKAKEIAVTQVGDSIKGVQEHLTRSQDEIITALNSFLKEFTEQLTTLRDNLNQTLTKQHESLVESANAYLSSLEKSIDSFSSSISTIVTNLKDFLVSFMNEYGEEAKTNLLGHKEKVNSLMEESMNQASVQANELMEKLSEEYNDLLTSIQGTLESKRDDVKKQVEDAHNTAHQQLTDLEEQTTSKVKEFVESFDEDYKNVLNLVDKELEETRQRIDEIKNEAKQAEASLEKNVGSRLENMEDMVHSSFNTHIQDGLNSFERRMNLAKEKHERALKEFFEDFLDLTGTLRDKVPRESEQLFVDHMNRFTTFQQNYNQTVTQLVSTLNEFIATAEQNKGWMKKKENQVAIEKLKNLREGMLRDKEQIQNMLQTIIDDTERTKDSVLNQITKVFTEEIENIEEEQYSEVRKVSKNLDEIVQTQRSAIEEISQSLKSQLESSREEYLRALKNDLTTFFSNKLIELLGKTETAAMAVRPGETESKFKQVLTTYSDLLHSTSQEFIATLNTNLQDATENLTKSKNHMLSLSDSAYEIATGAVQEGSEKSKEALNDIVKQTMEVFDKTRAELGDSLETIVEDTDSKVKALIKEKQEEIQSRVTTDLDALTSETENTKKDIKETVATLISTSESFTNDTINQSSAQIEKSMKDQEVLITNTNNALQDMIQASLKFLDERKTMLSSEVGETLDQTLSAVNSLPTTSDKEFAKLTKEAKANAKQAREPLTGIVKSISESGQGFDDELKKLQDGKASLGKAVNEKAQGLVQATRDKLGTVVSTYEDGVTKHLEDFTTQHKDSMTGVKKASKDFGNNELQKAKNDAEVLLTSIKKELEDAFYKTETDVKKEVDFMENSIEKEANQVRVQHEKASTAIKAGTTTQAKTIQNAFLTLGSTLNDVIQSQTDKDTEKAKSLDDAYKQHLTTFSEEFKTKVFADVDTSISELRGAVESIPGAITQALDETGKALEFFKRLSAALKGTDPLPIELTYLDAGREAIENALNAMIKESKRSFTVVSSSIEWMDKELLQGLSMSKQLNVITDPDKHNNKDKEILNLLKNINANVTLRRFSEDQDPILLADRDSEAILIGLPLRSKNPYSIITLDERLVRMLQQIITPLRNKPRLT